VRHSLRGDMLSTVHKISSVLLVALGVVHTALTPVFYGRFSHNAMWFAGSGLAMIFAGLLNIMLSRDVGRDRLVRLFCYAANLLTVVFGFLILTLDREPQVIFGFVLIVLMTVTALLKVAPNGRASLTEED
jgi:hypothetical protein